MEKLAEEQTGPAVADHLAETYTRVSVFTPSTGTVISCTDTNVVHPSPTLAHVGIKSSAAAAVAEIAVTLRYVKLLSLIYDSIVICHQFQGYCSRCPYKMIPCKLSFLGPSCIQKYSDLSMSWLSGFIVDLLTRLIREEGRLKMIQISIHHQLILSEDHCYYVQ